MPELLGSTAILWDLLYGLTWPLTMAMRHGTLVVMKPEKTEDLLTLREASAILGRSYRSLLRDIKDDRLEARKIDNQWYTTKSQLADRLDQEDQEYARTRAYSHIFPVVLRWELTPPFFEHLDETISAIALRAIRGYEPKPPALADRDVSPSREERAETFSEVLAWIRKRDAEHSWLYDHMWMDPEDSEARVVQLLESLPDCVVNEMWHDFKFLLSVREKRSQDPGDTTPRKRTED